MAITQAKCTAMKLNDLLAADVFKIALYTSAAALDASTAAYTTSNEVVGAGYVAGGATLTGTVRGQSGVTGWLDFSDAAWAASTITARGALIYNSSRGNYAMAVLDFGSDKTSTSGTFTVIMPVADAANDAVREA